MLAATASSSLTTRPIVLLGYVGVGKSMFIRHLVRIEAKDLFEKAMVLYIDLGAEPALERLEPYVAEHFIRELKRRHGVNIFERDFARRVYAQDLAEFRESPWGELAETNEAKYREKEIEHLAGLLEKREEHLKRSLDHLSEHGKHQVVTILDNVDQRESAFQDRIFVLAETLAKTWPGTVFVALRPDTFNRSKRAGALTAYQPRVFAVAPPRVDDVIQKRLSFGRAQITAHGRLPATHQAVRNTDDLYNYLDILARSFRRRDELKELIDNLSGGNIRRALELLTTYISSPHAGAERALKTYDERGAYFIPYHVFLKAIMLGDRSHYDPSSSLVANLLDISTDDPREHFLLPILLSLLRRTAEPGVHEGYVPVGRVYSFCQDLGFTPVQIAWQLDRAVAANLIEVSPLDGAPELYRSTSIGNYTEQRLLSTFTYIDEIIVDTPVTDDIRRAVLEDVRATDLRLQRARGFCSYLDSAWDQVASRDSGFDWLARSTSLAREMDRIEALLSGQRRPPRTPDIDF